MYYKNGQVFNSQQAIRNDMKDTSLPVFMTDGLIESLGYQVVVEAVKPEVTAVQTIQDGGVQLISGVPTQVWKVVDKFADTAEVLAEDGVTVVTPAKTKLQHETEYLAKLQAGAMEATKQRFKNMYLATVDAKLKAMDYDSLATVKLWVDDATFGAEATRIITWYKALIAMNYALITAIVGGTATVPTEIEYQAMIDGVVF